MNISTFFSRLVVSRLNRGLNGLLSAGAVRPLRAGLAALSLGWLAVAPAAAQTYSVTTRAGMGVMGYSGDGGTAASAQLNFPFGVAVDGSNNLFIADYNNNRIRKVSGATGVITTVAGTGTIGFGGDGGPATSAHIWAPASVAIDGRGNLFFADNGNNRIRKVSAATGVITTVAGNSTGGYSGDGGAAISAQLANPNGVAVDGSGNLFIADQGNQRIRKVSATGVITTVAGTGARGYSGDGGPATSAQLADAFGVAADGSGNVFIAEQGNGRIRKVSAATGIITTVAGTGTIGFGGDGGPATSAQLRSPASVAVDGSGNLFFADQGNQRIRKVSATGVITTVAGTGTRGYSGDGGTATSAQLNSPIGVAVDGNGNVFIADQGNNRIRQLTPASPTSARPALAAATVLVYPNPTHGTCTVLVPAGAGTTPVQAELLNALGQPVRRQVAVSGVPFTMETAVLAPGVYTLRLQAGNATLARRLVVQ